MHPRAGQPARPEDLIDVDEVVNAYYDLVPDPAVPEQRVVFGTSGHRGSSLDTAFNEAHIIATTAAIVEYRRTQGTDGVLYIGRDTHALSEPAWRTAIEVLTGAGVTTAVDARGAYTPTPAVSHSILLANGAGTESGVRTSGPGLADGIVVTPSHNPPRDGGFKYNPPHGGPADSDATSWIAARANELLADGWDRVKRVPIAEALDSNYVIKHDYLESYVADLENVIDVEAIREAGVRIGADPLGGASVDYWGAIAERYGLDLTVVNPTVDPAWSFMTLDWDGKIRMDCSSPNAMASLRAVMTPDADGKTPYDVATGNDADSDRHGIVTPDGLMNPNHYLAVAIEYLFTHRPQWPATAAVGKTLVSSSLIDRVVAAMGRTLVEVPVGFKHFVPGLIAARWASVARRAREPPSCARTARCGPRTRTASSWRCWPARSLPSRARPPRSCTRSRWSASAPRPTHVSTPQPPRLRRLSSLPCPPRTLRPPSWPASPSWTGWYGRLAMTLRSAVSR